VPWLRSRTERSSGVTTWAIEWREGGRDGKVRSRSLGPVGEKEAQHELAAMQAGKTARRAAPQAMAGWLSSGAGADPLTPGKLRQSMGTALKGRVGRYELT
jgi:hypothetical protein